MHKLQCYIMSVGSSYHPCTIFHGVIILWIIWWGQFHIDEVQPILTWIIVNIFNSTNPFWTTFAIKNLYESESKFFVYVVHKILQLLLHLESVEWAAKSIICWPKLKDIWAIVPRAIPIALQKHSKSIVITCLHYL